MRIKLFCSSVLVLAACGLQTHEADNAVHFVENNYEHFQSIGEIPVPEGFSRLQVKAGSFAEWLRGLHLKKDNRVFLYNGQLKANQTAQFAVLDMPVGNKDLQQCADAVMRLYAEYFLSKNDFDAIAFHATDGTLISFADWRKGKRYKLSGSKLQSFFIHTISSRLRDDFEDYLETVFSYAGTASLSTELKEVADIDAIEPGNVFIKPGFPGHAMLVIDVAVNNKGEKIFLLAQGYMPAQDIHIVKNPENTDDYPWYKPAKQIRTPEWTFTSDQLKERK